MGAIMRMKLKASNFLVKMTMRPCSLALPVIGALVAGGSVASAATFDYNGYSVVNEQTIQILTPHNIYGGMGEVTLHGAGGNLNESLNVWCLDIFTYLLGSDTYNQGPLTIAGANGSTNNPALTTTQIGEIGALMANANALISANSNASAAIQMAIWMTEYPTFGYTGVTPATSALATTYYDYALAGTGSWGPVSSVTLLTSVQGLNKNQDMGFVDPGLYLGSSFTTPLPSTWTMILAGFAGLGFLAYRGNKRNTAAPAAA
jgi:hypothetical protein